jgi:hypothetical protein
VYKWIIIILFFLPLAAESQGLFEEPVQQDAGSWKNIQMNGFIRGDLYLGDKTAPLVSGIRSGYGEVALKMSYSGLERVRVYTEVRIRSGYEYNQWIGEIQLREAYADLSLGNFDLRIGQQVISWGRADGINPTHSLTPQDYFVRSPETDDMNMGNLMFRGQFSPIDEFRIEAVWVPVYKYSVYRFDLFDVPDYVDFKESKQPQANLKNGTFAIRAEWFYSSFDGSISWFSGYDPMPGIEPAALPETPMEDFSMIMYKRAFRQQTLGLDFSSGRGSFGVRGEAAIRIPDRDYNGEIFAPRSDIRYVLGIDRVLGNFSILAMYAGQFVIDFTKTAGPSGIPDIDPLQLQDPAAWDMLDPMMDQQLEGFNRIIFNQTRQITHSLGMRPALSLFYDVLEAEIFSLYNFTTEEWNIHPKITWRVSDNVKLIAGGQYFCGPENTMYDMIAPVFNGGFLEIRYTF